MTEDELGQVTMAKLTNCARCGETHTNVIFFKFERPIEPEDCPGVKWTHWAKCKNTYDPILLREIEE